MACPVTYLKLTIEYDGTDFSGWQSQANGRTVQDVLEDACHRVTGEKPRITGAGRTDAGVHASGQVASLALRNDKEPIDLCRSLNGVLPEDVVIQHAERVPETFHARYSAVSRQYRYSIYRGSTALHRRTAWSVGWELNTSYLTECAKLFQGRHNFRSFSKSGSPVKDWMCDIHRSEWTIDGSFVEYSVEANRFLYGMVRALVGTMVEVARSYRPIADISTIMNGEDRALAGMAAPAHGLTLVKVTY